MLHMKPREQKPDAMLRDHLHDELRLVPARDRRQVHARKPQSKTGTTSDVQAEAQASEPPQSAPTGTTYSGTRRGGRRRKGR
jgi:hypothetical protein